MMDVASLTTATADVDLNGDSNAPLQVDISDALSEKDKVKFTVHTRSAVLASTHTVLIFVFPGRDFQTSRNLSSQ